MAFAFNFRDGAEYKKVKAEMMEEKASEQRGDKPKTTSQDLLSKFKRRLDEAKKTDLVEARRAYLKEKQQQQASLRVHTENTVNTLNRGADEARRLARLKLEADATNARAEEAMSRFGELSQPPPPRGNYEDRRQERIYSRNKTQSAVKKKSCGIFGSCMGGTKRTRKRRRTRNKRRTKRRNRHRNRRRNKKSRKETARGPVLGPGMTEDIVEKRPWDWDTNPPTQAQMAELQRIFEAETTFEDAREPGQGDRRGPGNKEIKSISSRGRKALDHLLYILNNNIRGSSSLADYKKYDTFADDTYAIRDRTPTPTGSGTNKRRTKRKNKRKKRRGRKSRKN